MKDGADLCLKFHDLNWENGTFTGCVDLIGYLFDIKIGTIRIGCFNLSKTVHQFQFFREVSIINFAPKGNSNDGQVLVVNTVVHKLFKKITLNYFLNRKKSNEKSFQTSTNYTLIV